MVGIRLGADKSKKATKPEKSRLLLGDDDEDDNSTSSLNSSKRTPKQLQRPLVKLKDEEIDPSVYDYDAAYDTIHAARAVKEAARKEEAISRKPKYIDNFLSSAALRKRDQLRAKEKEILKEREAEGDEFADKEQFVTSAYKKQLEENKKLEEDELREEEEAARQRQKSGMRAFYGSVLALEDQKQQDAAQAAALLAETPDARLDASADKEATYRERAKELAEKGVAVLTNDDGQVADKRQLLSAGLNLGVSRGKNSRLKADVLNPFQQRAQASRSETGAGPDRHNKAASRERQSQWIEEQMEKNAKRAADLESQELQKKAESVRSKKTSTDIESARERYLKRKRAQAGLDANE